MAEADDARPLEGALEVLHSLARRLGLVAVVSGRPASFLYERLELARYASPLRAVGLHGLEEARADGSVVVRPEAAAWRPALAAARDELAGAVAPGIVVEDKGLGVTVHWRVAAAEPGADGAAVAAQATALVQAVAGRLELVARPGRASVELVAPVGVDKGTVVRELCGPLARAAYLGDDDGDRFAFEALDELGSARGLDGWKIAVASSEVPERLVAAADVVLDGPAAAVALLGELLAAV